MLTPGASMGGMAAPDTNAGISYISAYAAAQRAARHRQDAGISLGPGTSSAGQRSGGGAGPRMPLLTDMDMAPPTSRAMYDLLEDDFIPMQPDPNQQQPAKPSVSGALAQAAAGARPSPAVVLAPKEQLELGKSGRRRRLILIDGQNVSCVCSIERVFNSSRCLSAIYYFRSLGHEVKCIFPRNYNVCGRSGNEREANVLQKFVVWSPARVITKKSGGFVKQVSDDDLYLLDFAKRTGGVVVSNDQFRKELKDYGDEFREVIEKRLLQYSILTSSAGQVFSVARDPYGRDSDVTLEEFLTFPPGEEPGAAGSDGAPGAPSREQMLADLEADTCNLPVGIEPRGYRPPASPPPRNPGSASDGARAGPSARMPPPQQPSSSSATPSSQPPPRQHPLPTSGLRLPSPAGSGAQRPPAVTPTKQPIGHYGQFPPPGGADFNTSTSNSNLASGSNSMGVGTSNNNNNIQVHPPPTSNGSSTSLRAHGPSRGGQSRGNGGGQSRRRSNSRGRRSRPPPPLNIPSGPAAGGGRHDAAARRQSSGSGGRSSVSPEPADPAPPAPAPAGTPLSQGRPGDVRRTPGQTEKLRADLLGLLPKSSSTDSQASSHQAVDLCSVLDQVLEKYPYIQDNVNTIAMEVLDAAEHAQQQMKAAAVPSRDEPMPNV